MGAKTDPMPAFDVTRWGLPAELSEYDAIVCADCEQMGTVMNWTTVELGCDECENVRLALKCPKCGNLFDERVRHALIGLVFAPAGEPAHPTTSIGHIDDDMVPE